MTYYEYTIDKNNVIKFTYNYSLDEFSSEEDNIPEITQKAWPDTTPWKDLAEATAWADAFLEVLNNPEHTHRPGETPSEPLIEVVREEPEPEVEPEPSES